MDDRHLGYIKKNSSKKHWRIHIQFGVEIWMKLDHSQPNPIQCELFTFNEDAAQLNITLMPAAVMLQWKNSIRFSPEHSMFRYQPRLPTSKPYSQLHLHVWDTLLPELNLQQPNVSKIQLQSKTNKRDSTRVQSVSHACQPNVSKIQPVRDYCSNKITVFQVTVHVIIYWNPGVQYS